MERSVMREKMSRISLRSSGLRLSKLSHHLRAGRLQYLAQLAFKLGEERLELGRLHELAVELALVEEPLPAGGLARLEEQVLVIGNRLRRHAGRADDTTHLRHVRN